MYTLKTILASKLKFLVVSANLSAISSTGGALWCSDDGLCTDHLGLGIILGSY